MPGKHGGLRNPPGGRPVGAKDRMPRKGSRWHGWAEEVSQKYDADEYFLEVLPALGISYRKYTGTKQRR
jgi:hypothetical protein